MYIIITYASRNVYNVYFCCLIICCFTFGLVDFVSSYSFVLQLAQVRKSMARIKVVLCERVSELDSTTQLSLLGELHVHVHSVSNRLLCCESSMLKSANDERSNPTHVEKKRRLPLSL